MKISVFGLGYVGCVSAACFASEGNEVIGVDINEDKVKDISNGISPIAERDIDRKIKQVVEQGLLRTSSDAHQAVMETDISFLCVGTPSKRNGAFEPKYLEKVCFEIAGILKKKKSRHLIVNRSTALPGTLKLLEVIVQKESKKNPGSEFGIACNPEFLREGTAVEDFYNPPYTIIGIDEKKEKWALAMLIELYSFLSTPIMTLSGKEAELVKYANNYFHALKVTFANEIGRISKKMGIDSRKVMHVVIADKKLNLSSYYLRPGFAFGGSCLPKDVRALNDFSSKHDIDAQVIKATLQSNESHIIHALGLITEKGHTKVGFLGLAFKPDTDDLRESPTVSLIEKLLGIGYPISIFDSNVYYERLIGSNREFILQHLSHFLDLLTEDINELIRSSKVIVATQKIKLNEEQLKLLNGKHVIDLVGWDELEKYCGEYSGICW